VTTFWSFAAYKSERTDLVDFATPIAIAKQALDALQSLRKIEKALDQATLKAELAEVTSKMADVRMALLEAREEAGAKDAEIARLLKEFEARADLVTVGQFKYYPAASDRSKPFGFPICPRCEQIEGRIVLLREADLRHATCPHCKTTYRAWYYNEPAGSPA